MFVIEDELHAEPQPGEFTTLQDAVDELRRRAAIPWNAEPNQAPCASWETCGRKYEVVEFDASDSPRREIGRTTVLEISADGIHWWTGFEP